MQGVVLIGYRGSGKSTVGRLLADQREMGFVDTDALVTHLAGKEISSIFAEEGEAGFRKREAEAIKLALAAAGRVVSVGGGAVERAANRKALRRYGTVIWLEAPAEVLWDRIKGDPATAAQRPDLSVGGLAEIESVLARRNRLYAETSHLTVRVAGLRPSDIVDDIETLLATLGD
jgi:shikimate kinase